MLLVGTVLVLFAIGGVVQRREDVSSLTRDRSGRDTAEVSSDLDETFPYDVAARFNDGVVANIDAIDTALTTILAGNVAVLVLAIDKIKELAPTQAASAIVLLSVSMLSCVIAYALGFSVHASKRDGLRPRMVIPDLLERPNDALIAAVIDLVSAGEHNLTMRFLKKSLAVLAMLLLLAGAVVIALARASGGMIY